MSTTDPIVVSGREISVTFFPFSLELSVHSVIASRKAFVQVVFALSSIFLRAVV